MFANHRIRGRVLRVLLGPAVALLVAVPGQRALGGGSPLQGEPRAQAYLHYSVGRLMEAGGALTEALVQYRRADALDRGQCGIRLSIIRTLLALGRVEEASAGSMEALALCPDSDDALALRAEVQLTKGQAEGAAGTLRERAIMSDAPRAIASLYAHALLSQERYREGEAYLSSRAELDSLDARVAELHGRALLLLDDAEGAVREFTRAVRLDPGSRSSLGMLSRLLISLERPEEAIPLLERLLAQYEGLESEFLSLAAGYSMVGDAERAHALLDTAETRFGTTEALLRARGAAYFNEGHIDMALAAYEELLEAHPESAVALNFIAYTLADEGRELERALRYAERAVEVDSENPLVRDTLGWVYYRLGRLEEARAQLGRAVELGASDPVVYDHLGDIQAALGLDDSACESWRRALGLAPEAAPIRQKIRARCGLGEAPGGEEGER